MNTKQFFEFQWTSALMIVVVSLTLLGACKNPETSDTSSAQTKTPIAPTANNQQNANRTQSRNSLTATEWLTKQNISAEEERTVNALLRSIADIGGPSNDPTAAARWADKKLQIAVLSDEGLTEVAPILVFKKIVTLTISGNKFTQEQLNQLLAGLPNLKTLVKDKNLKCDNLKYPKVVCLE
jgi:hypothetical protein